MLSKFEGILTASALSMGQEVGWFDWDEECPRLHARLSFAHVTLRSPFSFSLSSSPWGISLAKLHTVKLPEHNKQDWGTGERGI